MLSNKMMKKIAAAIALLLAAIMVFSAIASGLSFSASAATGVSGLKKQLSSIESEKAALKKEIAALDSQINVVSEKKAALDRQMELTQDEIDTTEALIKELADQIAIKTEELDAAILELEEKTELFETRIRVMYENGEVTYLDVLLTSENFGDMLSRMEIVGQIMDYDKKVVVEYTAAKEDIEQKKADLETDKADEESYKSTLESKYDTLESQEQAQAKLLSDLNADVEKKKAETEKMEAEKSSIQSEIARLSREAAAAAAAKSGGSSGGGATPVSGSFTWPLPGYGTDCISSQYGYRIHPITGKRKLHAGTDMAVPKGATIVAAKSGTVVKSYMSNSYGNYIVIDHGGGVMTAYAHQSKRLVSAGEQVSAGQKIGLVGSTGNSTGNHLHYEVYVNGSTVNPMQYFN